MSQDTRPSRAPGSTLVELLIVVAILGILGAMVVPRFSDAARNSRETVLKDSLRTMRNQVRLYTAHHGQRPPGYPPGQSSGATETLFRNQMTRKTNALGQTGNGEDFGLGPYLRSIPENPVNGLRSVRIVNGPTFPDDPAGSHGWVYQPSTLRLAADSVGSDESGVRYFDY